MRTSRLRGSDAIRRMGALVRAMWTRAVGDSATLARLGRGQHMADRKGQVKRLAHNRYEVRSQSKESVTYTVRFGDKGASCECPDHQYRKTVCKHIAAVIQRNSDAARDRAGGNVPDAAPAPDPGVKQAEPVLDGEPGAAEPAGTNTGKGGNGKGGNGKGGNGKDSDGAADSAAKEITKEEAVARLTANFPRLNISRMPDMPPKEAVLAMAGAFERLTPQEATADVREHAQALLLALVCDVAAEHPEMIINLMPADDTPSACPHCGAACTRYGSRENQKGTERTYLCRGPEPHRFTFNPGFEGRRYPDHVIAGAVDLYAGIRSARLVAHRLRRGGKGPHHATVPRWVRDMVWGAVAYLRKMGMGGIGHHSGTDGVLEEVMGKGSCVATVSDYDARFCLAVQVSPTRDGQNSAGLFGAAREMSGRDPPVTRR